MKKLSDADLYKLEDYARERNAFRARVIAHKRLRKVHLGAHLNLLFEDSLTIQYQVQEMLRIERIFETAAINEELDSYNPLIPDGKNLKATLLIEYPDPDIRKDKLVALRGIERVISLRIGEHAASIAIADEDLPRENAEKTSAVHFLRFEFDTEAIAAWRAGAAVTLAVDHPQYREQCDLDAATRAALLADFD